MKFNRLSVQPTNLLDRFSDCDEVLPAISMPLPPPDLYDDTSCDSGFGDDTVSLSPVTSQHSPVTSLEPEINPRRRKRPFADITSPLNNKRVKLSFTEELDISRESKIKSALSEETKYLTGDFSSSHCLPKTAGRHSDLNSITPDTLSHLMSGDYSDVVGSFVIVDCRYPYEYQGGHLPEARNLYTQQLVDGLLSQPMTSPDPAKRHVIVFHCEFSSERGPKLARYLRSEDRVRNAENYPALTYPELYLLDGGYSHFYQQRPDYQLTYTSMFDDKYSHQLRKFRTETKSSKRGKSRRNLDSVRSRLRF